MGYRKKPITSFEERKAIISNLRCVDMIIPQKKKRFYRKLKKINGQFKEVVIILVHGDNCIKFLRNLFRIV